MGRVHIFFDGAFSWEVGVYILWGVHILGGGLDIFQRVYVFSRRVGHILGRNAHFQGCVDRAIVVLAMNSHLTLHRYGIYYPMHNNHNEHTTFLYR
jgi:hypothetical protein